MQDLTLNSSKCQYVCLLIEQRDKAAQPHAEIEPQGRVAHGVMIKEDGADARVKEKIQQRGQSGKTSPCVEGHGNK